MYDVKSDTEFLLSPVRNIFTDPLPIGDRVEAVQNGIIDSFVDYAENVIGAADIADAAADALGIERDDT